MYADMSNIMFSYITSEESVGFTFNRYINTVIHLLRKLGVEATTSGRNDILIDGKKYLVMPSITYPDATLYTEQCYMIPICEIWLEALRHQTKN